MFEIETDEPAGIISIAVTGFWTLDTVAAFVRALSAQSASFAVLGRKPALLYDFTGAVIQSQEVVAAWQEIGRAAPARARRVAVVVHGAMGHMQVRRTAMPGSRIFEDRDEARAWLLAD